MSLNTQRRGQIGVNIVESIILNEWKGRWQAIDGHNDDGIDGLIFLEANGQMTGQIIFAQVKCFGGVRIDGNDRFCLSIGKAKLEKNLRRWRRLVGAAIIIYVDPKSRNCYWADALDPEAVKGSQIFVSKHSAFNASARPIVARLCGNIHRDMLALQIRTEVGDFPHLRSKDHIQPAARRLYQDLRQNPVRLGGDGPIVRFDRHGWRHITRPARAALTRYQSLVLLGTARKMIEAHDEEMLKHHEAEARPDDHFVAARAAVIFPFRQTGIVKIILQVIEGEAQRVYRFHTIYEPRRRRDVLGRENRSLDKLRLKP